MLFNDSCAYKHCSISTSTQILGAVSSHLPNSVPASLQKSPLVVAGRCGRCLVPFSKQAQQCARGDQELFLKAT